MSRAPDRALELALVYPSLAHKGGAEAVVVWTAVGLHRRGRAVRVFTADLDPGLWPDFPELAGLVEQVDPVRHRDRWERALRTGRSLASRLAGFPVVLAHGRYGLLWSLEAPGRLAFYCHEPSRRLYAPETDHWLVEALGRDDLDPGLPALRHFRERLRRLRAFPRGWWKVPRLRRREREFVARAGKVLVNSRYNAASVARVFGVEAEVLPPGLPGAAGLPPVEALPPPDQRSDVAVVASASPWKNLHGVLAAAAELERRGALPDIRFHVWGIGTDREDFQELRRQWRLESRVTLHGFLEDGEARRRMQTSRLCLFLPLCEPFGIVAAEALQSGTPVLGSDHGGPAEILADCGGGRTADPLRPDRVADRLVEMLDGEAAWHRAWEEAQAAAVLARRRYGLERFLERHEGLLDPGGPEPS